MEKKFVVSHKNLEELIEISLIIDNKNILLPPICNDFINDKKLKTFDDYSKEHHNCVFTVEQIEDVIYIKSWSCFAYKQSWEEVTIDELRMMDLRRA